MGTFHHQIQHKREKLRGFFSPSPTGTELTPQHECGYRALKADVIIIRRIPSQERDRAWCLENATTYYFPTHQDLSVTSLNKTRQK